MNNLRDMHRNIAVVGIAAANHPDILGVMITSRERKLQLLPPPTSDSTRITVEMPKSAADKILEDPEAFKAYIMKELGIEITQVLTGEKLGNTVKLCPSDLWGNLGDALQRDHEKAKLMAEPFIPKESSFERAHRGSPHLLKKRGWRNK